MTVELSDIAGCFQGFIPSIIATSSSDGEPNVAHLSQVFLVDDQHVATSNQFFAKTMANLAENPLATLMCPDPADLTSYKLLVRHVGSQREGALFDAARRVDRCHRGPHWNGRCLCPEIDGCVSGTEHRSSGSAITDPGDVSQQDPTTIALRRLGDRLASTTGLEVVIDASLDSIDELLGHRSSLLLVYQPELDRLVTLASHGYDSGGVGSEVALGEGVIGMAAARQRSMRIGNLQRMLSYARTVQRTATSDATAVDDIRLPGLTDAGSQMAVPLIARGVLLGVLAVESRSELAYDEHDENVLAVAAHMVAAALEREQLLSNDSEVTEPVVVQPASPAAASSTSPSPPAAGGDPSLRHRRHHFLDDDYVIKGVAGRLLWKLISDYSSTGRRRSQSRSQLDPVLGLPPYRDNFESRWCC